MTYCNKPGHVPADYMVTENEIDAILGSDWDYSRSPTADAVAAGVATVID